MKTVKSVNPDSVLSRHLKRPLALAVLQTLLLKPRGSNHCKQQIFLSFLRHNFCQGGAR